MTNKNVKDWSSAKKETDEYLMPMEKHPSQLSRSGMSFFALIFIFGSTHGSQRPDTTAPRKKIFTRLPVDDVIFSVSGGDILMDAPTRSLLECSKQCAEAESCEMYTFYRPSEEFLWNRKIQATLQSPLIHEGNSVTKRLFTPESPSTTESPPDHVGPTALTGSTNPQGTLRAYGPPYFQISPSTGCPSPPDCPSPPESESQDASPSPPSTCSPAPGGEGGMCRLYRQARTTYYPWGWDYSSGARSFGRPESSAVSCGSEYDWECDSCLHADDHHVEYSNAANQCQEDSAWLPMPESKEAVDCLINFASAKGLEQFWLGAKSTEIGTGLQWEDGTPFNRTIYIGLPGISLKTAYPLFFSPGNCLSISKRSRQNDQVLTTQKCNEELPYICQNGP